MKNLIACIKAFFGFKPKAVAARIEPLPEPKNCPPMPRVRPAKNPMPRPVRSQPQYSYGSPVRAASTPTPQSDDDGTSAFLMGAMLGSAMQSAPSPVEAIAPAFVSGNGGDFGGGGASGSWGDDTPAPAYEPPAPSPAYESPAPSPSYESSSSSSSWSSSDSSSSSSYDSSSSSSSSSWD